MRFTSLIVELVRARPKLIFWIVVLAQAAVWLLLPTLLYRSPPGDMATLLVFGREYQVGTDIGPPLAFWLADLAFRAAGHHVFGVYLLSQACFVVTMWALFELGAAVVGRQQSVLAVMLTATFVVFSFPGVEFDPQVLARPLWALVLLHGFRVVGQGRGNAWFALSIEAGLLLLTTHAAVVLLVLLFGFMLATARGRRALASVDPWFALIVVLVLVLPYLMWLVRANSLHLPPLPAAAELPSRATRWGELVAALVVVMAGIACLAIANAPRWSRRRPEDAPTIFRPPVDPFGRHYVLFFACAPALVLTLVTALFGFPHIAGGAGTVLLPAGIAAVLFAGDLIPLRRQEVLRTVWAAIIAAPAAATVLFVLLQPWAGIEVKTSLPAAEIGRFFGESFERRTGQPLRAVAGDPQLASLIALGAARQPHLFLDAAPERTPWLNAAKFAETGGIVVWRAADTAGTPPGDIAARFPDLAPEVPRVFERTVNGRLPPLRIGWGIVRPKSS